MIADGALEGLLPLIQGLLSSPQRLAQMATAVRSLAPLTSGAEAIAELLVGLAQPVERTDDALVRAREP
jgi:hypothetical protein